MFSDFLNTLSADSVRKNQHLLHHLARLEHEMNELIIFKKLYPDNSKISDSEIERLRDEYQAVVASFR